jgi:hypothetical protein
MDGDRDVARFDLDPEADLRGAGLIEWDGAGVGVTERELDR